MQKGLHIQFNKLSINYSTIQFLLDKTGPYEKYKKIIT